MYGSSVAGRLPRNAHVVVVLCHPNPDGFAAASARAATGALTASGHRVTLLDLYAGGFDPVMSRDDLFRYQSRTPDVPGDLEGHVDAVTSADALVFVYPTWWSGLPAVLKGWLERVMVPGVAFVFDAEQRVRPALTNIKRIVIISTYGSPRRYIAVVNDNGRRVLARALRMTCGWRTRTTSIRLFAMDTRDDADRQRHLRHIERKMRSL